jgi:hypothetical protein
VPQSFTFAAVARTGIRVAGTFDTLLGPPQQGWPPAADSYSQLMETNLTAISKALSCPTSTT